jgi:hypothetical protein
MITLGDQIEFLGLLARLKAAGTSATRKELPSADRRADKVRQSCRRAGLCKFVNGAWLITRAGERFLQDHA